MNRNSLGTLVLAVALAACGTHRSPAAPQPRPHVTITTEEVTILEPVVFAAGSAELDATVPTLDAVADILDANTAITQVEVQGYADEDEPLAIARAEAAKAYLVERGVAEARLTTAGHDLVADGATIDRHGQLDFVIVDRAD